MNDKSIVELFWERSEQAIVETDRKYGDYCYSIAYHALANNEDAEESVNDTYMAAWNQLPPHRPSVLATFLGNQVRANYTKERPGQYPSSMPLVLLSAYGRSKNKKRYDSLLLTFRWNLLLNNRLLQ